MRKIFVLMLSILAFIVVTNVKAENLVMNYYGNPYYVISGNGEYHSSIATFFELNGDVAYCVEPGILVTDFSYHIENIDMLPYSNTKLNLVKLIGYYGYEYPNHLNNSYRLATQALIWETLTEKSVQFYTEKNGNGNYIDLTNERNEIMNLVNNHYTLPNISNELNLSIYNDNILIDSNNVLNNFEIINDNKDLDIYIENNKLHIKSNKVGDYNIVLKKIKYQNKTSLLYVADNKVSQKLVKLGLDYNLELNINIHIEGGKLFLSKLDSETKSNYSLGSSNLRDAKYGIYDENNNLIEELITDNLGKSSSNYLKFGKYYLKEIKASYGYLLDNNKYEFIINHDNLDKNLEVYENLNKKEVTIIKTIEGDYSVLLGEENIKFNVYLKDSNKLYKTITTNKLGVAKLELPYGEYIFHQINTPSGYLKSDDFLVVIDENTDNIYKVIYDKRVRGKIEIIKSDIDSNELLKGAFIEIYKDNNLVYSDYTDSDGKIELNDLYIGTYKIIEKIAPNGYILDNKEYSVDITNDNFNALVEIKNKHEEILVPNTSLNQSSILKYSSVFIMSLGSILIFISKKKYLKSN